MLGHRLVVAEVLARWLFVGHIAFPQRWVEYYWMTIGTRALERQRRHDVKYAV